MKLNKLKLLNFKSHLDSRWDFNNNIVCFIGDNGSGKTNILDAIHYLSLTKSYFNSRDSININFDNIFFTILGEFEINNVISNVVCSYQNDTLKKVIKNNGKKYKRFSDHIGLFPVIFISPTDLKLITETSDLRRRFIDSSISQINSNYLKNIISYNKFLVQRNYLLKNYLKTGRLDHETINIYDDSLVKIGTYIYNERKKYLQKLIPIFQTKYNHLCDNKESVDIKYKSQLDEGDYSHLMLSNINKDKSSARTSIGVHKDDLIFNLNDFPINKHGSQGQKKSFITSLKMSQIEILKNEKNIQPILLLDDLYDKLDDKRVKRLIQLVNISNNNQVFITDTNKERIEKVMNQEKQDFIIFEI